MVIKVLGAKRDSVTESLLSAYGTSQFGREVEDHFTDAVIDAQGVFTLCGGKLGRGRQGGTAVHNDLADAFVSGDVISGLGTGQRERDLADAAV